MEQHHGAQSSRLSREQSEESSEPEVGGRTDLEGLLDYLDSLSGQGVRIVEAHHVANQWALGGVIPMTHHGFVMKGSNGEYFSLDFGRKGIVWDTYGDESPEEPDDTIFSKQYTLNLEVQVVRQYCEETKPFQWMYNDCETWSRGLMKVMGIAPRGQQVGSLQLCGFGGEAIISNPFVCLGLMGKAPPVDSIPSPAPKVDSRPQPPKQQQGRRQRTGDCL
eukprot:TRINITY_DN108857_c0_g1_i1.p1 TRINITY_DN108857_c0_g1~~TRINITY_DN108857_c0_g1_i1.p1  ORF type:complete len:220 (-),score=33.43 TRINITY_DN108857_c0_g1_i1:93-752(-)